MVSYTLLINNVDTRDPIGSKNLSSFAHKSFALHLTRTAPAALSVFVAVLSGDAVGDFADVAGCAGAGGHLHCLLFS